MNKIIAAIILICLILFLVPLAILIICSSIILFGIATAFGALASPFIALSQMGMRHLADSIVGGVVKRGISGGEKRRLSIATQLIQDPGARIIYMHFIL